MYNLRFYLLLTNLNNKTWVMQVDCVSGYTNVLNTKQQPKCGHLVKNDENNIRNNLTTSSRMFAIVLKIYFKHLQIRYQYIYEVLDPLCSAKTCNALRRRKCSVYLGQGMPKFCKKIIYLLILRQCNACRRRVVWTFCVSEKEFSSSENVRCMSYDNRVLTFAGRYQKISTFCYITEVQVDHWASMTATGQRNLT